MVDARAEAKEWNVAVMIVAEKWGEGGRAHVVCDVRVREGGATI